MCGLTGFFEPSGFAGNDAKIVASSMADRIRHRGPDDGGVWVDETIGLAFAHRRLAILDLSVAGHQPMVSASGHFVIIFNGEIYNHLSLRKDLERAFSDLNWVGHSDTETILVCFERWGILDTLKKCVGMFAFALFDRSQRVLTLARDRIGEKPLYYGWQGRAFLFGSELKALRGHPEFRGNVDRNSLTLLLRHNYIPAPYSIFEGIKKLLPGTILQMSLAHSNPGVLEEPVPYWSLAQTAEEGRNNPFTGTPEDAVQTLDELLRKAVGLQMLSDVPLGAFLSGGLDSSTIVALMQAQSGRPVKTFSIGFDEEAYNEAPYARAIARHLGTYHTEHILTPAESLDVIPRLPQIYDEPFSDSSQIPTFLVAQLARKQVTVALSGDGGDELFGGYPRYFLARNFVQTRNRVPRALQLLGARLLSAFSTKTWNCLFGLIKHSLPHSWATINLGEKVHKVAEILANPSQAETYRGMVSHWRNPDAIIIDVHEPATVLNTPAKWETIADFEHFMMFVDTLSYLPDDILVKVDRAAMGVSLETRIPLLDHRVVEFAWRLPLSMKMRGQQGKWLLRQVLQKYVPLRLIDRPKMGFGVPIEEWLRGPLRDWAEALLEESKIKREGYFRPEPILTKWREHLNGERNWQGQIWNILMFQAWIESW